MSRFPVSHASRQRVVLVAPIVRAVHVVAVMVAVGREKRERERERERCQAPPARPLGRRPAAPADTMRPGPRHPVGRVGTYITKPDSMTRRHGARAFTVRSARPEKNPTTVCKLLLHCCSALLVPARGQCPLPSYACESR